MRQHVHIASRRRDERLAMVRKLTLWITGGAAAASLGLGTAFASSVPGHATGTTSTPSSSTAQHSGAASTSPAAQKPAGTQHSSQSSQLSQPQQQPSQTTAPPVVTSGGS
jgi:hypothetical protein